tara:strand:+ start:49 stop:594 length:546 start_codon:yes stop_codon:yes gene_type:complete
MPNLTDKQKEFLYFELSSFIEDSYYDDPKEYEDEMQQLDKIYNKIKNNKKLTKTEQKTISDTISDHIDNSYSDNPSEYKSEIKKLDDIEKKLTYKSDPGNPFDLTEKEKEKVFKYKKELKGSKEYQKIMNKNQSLIKSDDEFHNLVLKKVVNERVAKKEKSNNFFKSNKNKLVKAERKGLL